MNAPIAMVPSLLDQNLVFGVKPHANLRLAYSSEYGEYSTCILNYTSRRAIETVGYQLIGSISSGIRITCST